MGMMMDFEATCPVDGTRFTYASTPSYSIFGRALDGLPRGSWFFPIRIPECPTCRFPAMFGELVGGDKVKAADFVESEGWRETENETSYWRLNAVETALGRSTPLRRVDRLLSATWQTYGDRARYGRYARELGQAMDGASQKIRADDAESWAALQGFVANVERQAGDFKRAAERLDRIEASGGLVPDLVERVALTRRLIADGLTGQETPDP